MTMNICKPSIMNWILISTLLSVSTVSYAASNPPVEFFASNNTHEIDVKTAYERLAGKAQRELSDNLIQMLQSNHIEQGKFADILGVYQMASDKNITSDNTEIFYASPLQHLSNKQIFSLAAQLANTLNQESVAVFIPSTQSAAGDVIVTFKSRKLGIAETINKIREKLPASYAAAFSLHLISECQGFNGVKVSEIEWLGSKANIDEIKKVFPGENISSHQGQAYLVYKNGQTEAL